MKSFPVSVIIPTFNRADVLERAIRSVQQQSKPPLEILVIDDGSTDNTATLVQRRFPEVRYIYQPRSGVSKARNRGIQYASGDWIAFLDSDDQWLPQKLEHQIQALQANPQYRICHTDEIWIRRGKRVNPKKKHQKHGGHIFHFCLPLCIVSPSSVLMHRSLFQEYGYFDESLAVCEDYDLWLRICAREPVLYVNEPLIVKYGGHPDQLSRQRWGMDRYRIYALEKLLALHTLTPDQRVAVMQELVRKIRVVEGGARKRGKWEEATYYYHKRLWYNYWLGSARVVNRVGEADFSRPHNPSFNT